MRKFNVNIISYRKLSFARKFGFTVRDLMFLKALGECRYVKDIQWFERPNIIHEALGSLVSRRVLSDVERRSVLFDPSVFGPLIHRRAWGARSLKMHEKELCGILESKGADSSIVLDFHPFYIPSKEIISRGMYWYDIIDTFSKHNRFTYEERCLAKKKMEFVREYASVVTGVTEKAVQSFPQGICVPNRILHSNFSRENGVDPVYDVGFLGFLTDKFDVEYVRSLSSRGIRILIAGHAYDQGVQRELSAIKNVDYVGPFTAHQARRLISQFKIGIVPYLVDKMHDESPIKFFQYAASGRPSILSTKFNSAEDLFGDNIYYYDSSNIDDSIAFIRRVTEDFDDISKKVQETAFGMRSMFWESSIDDIVIKAVEMASAHRSLHS